MAEAARSAALDHLRAQYPGVDNWHINYDHRLCCDVVAASFPDGADRLLPVARPGQYFSGDDWQRLVYVAEELVQGWIG